VVEALAQLFEPPVQPRAHRGDGNGFPLGNLRGAEVVEVPEQDGAPVRLREGDDLVDDLAVQLRALEQFERGCDVILGPRKSLLAPARSLLRSSTPAREIANQAAEPRAEDRGAMRGPLGDCRERLLHDVVRGCVIADQAPSEASHPGSVVEKVLGK